jgi:hypothetical protein
LSYRSPLIDRIQDKYLKVTTQTPNRGQSRAAAGFSLRCSTH